MALDKTTTNGGCFSSLPQDILMSILCRVPAADHTALKNTCKKFRQVIDSDDYATERATSNWAEVEARLISGEEIYDRDPIVEYSDGDDDMTEEEKAEKRAREREEYIEENYSAIGHHDISYGYDDVEIEIKVDGLVAGEINLVIIPRNRFFLEACDMHSSELQQVGCGLCDGQGRPKVGSIKQADIDGKANCGGYLHIKRVRINRKAYKKDDNTSIVAEAVRAALTVPELKGTWTLGTAICDARVYGTAEEESKRREISRRERRGEETNTVLDTTQAEQDKLIVDRWDEYVMLDARTFLRAGYKQIVECVGIINDQWYFVLPDMLRDTILSNEDAMAITVHVPPNLPPEPTGVDKELFSIIKKAFNSRKWNMDKLAKEESSLTQNIIEQTVRTEDQNTATIISQYEEQGLEAMITLLEKQQEECHKRMTGSRAKNEATRKLMIENRDVISAARDEGRDQQRINKAESDLQKSEEQVAIERSLAEKAEKLEAELVETERELAVYERKLNAYRQTTELARGQMEHLREFYRAAKTKQNTTTFEQRCAKKRNEMNQSINKKHEELHKDNEKLKADVTALINDKGASARNSFVLHCSTRFLRTDWVDFLLKFLPSDERVPAINDLDSSGCTPLHCALMGTPTLQDERVYFDTARHLIERGADKNITDPWGLTPLGQYRRGVRSLKEYYQAHTYMSSFQEHEDRFTLPETWDEINLRFESLLKPERGETEADKDAKLQENDDEEEDDEDDDIDMNDFDFEEDDN